MQRRRCWIKHYRRASTRKIQALTPGLSVAPLRNTHHSNTTQRQFIQHINCHIKLAAAAINQKKIRHCHVCAGPPAESSPEHLVHTRIIIARSDVPERKPPILISCRATRIEHDTRPHGRFSLRVTHVIALQPRHGHCYSKGDCQCRQPFCIHLVAA